LDKIIVAFILFCRF